jgi:hypothetical protein
MNLSKPILVAAACALLSVTSLPLGAQLKHVEVSDGWSRTPVTNDVLDARLRDAASEYREYAPVPRIALYDLTLPFDSLEAARLHGFGVVIITAVAQDSAELPLKRVFVRFGGREIDLQPLAGLLSTIDSAATDVRATFGAHRFDGLFLVPIAPLQSGEVDLVIDFAIRRSGFRIGVIEPDGLSSELRAYRAPDKAATPPMSAVRTIVKREFPGLPEGLLLLTQVP